MKPILLCLVTITVASSLSAQAQTRPKIPGTWVNADGIEVIQIASTADANAYKITFNQSHTKDRAEGIGYYNPNCNCLRGTFRYLTSLDKYGGNSGFLSFEFREPGNAFAHRGGWNDLKEWGPNLYVRKPD